MLLRAFGELLAGLAVAAVVSLGLQWMINRLYLPRPSNTPSVVITVAGTAAVVLLVSLVLARRWRLWSTPLTWCALSAAGTVPLSAILGGTRLYLDGLSVDQAFRTEYLTRLTDSAALADFAYQHVPPYYPAGWFWLGGRFANFFDLPGWAAFKPFAILTVAVVGVVAFTLWSLSVGRRTALALSAVTVCFALPTLAFEPYSWLVAATIPPLAALAWRLLRTLAAGGPAGRSTTVLLGLGLGVYGCLYTLYFFFAALLLGMLAVACLLWPPTSQGTVVRSRLLRRIAAHGVLLAVLTGAVMCLVWVPYLLGVARGMRGDNVAARFLPPGGAQVPTPFLDSSLTGALCLVGLLWLVATVRRHSRFSDVSIALATMVAACYLWYLLSQVALLGHTTLLAFRMAPVLSIALICAAVLALVEALDWGLPRLAVQWRWPIRTAAALLAVAVLLFPLQGLPAAAQHNVDLAFNDYYPTGRTAGGAANPADAGYWTPALNDAISELTHRPPNQNVLLGPPMLSETTPYWSFQVVSAHYANPLAEYEQRRTLVSTWSQSSSSADLVSQLGRSPFAAPSVFVFRHNGPELTVQMSSDEFPEDPNVKFYDVNFARSLFDGPEFTSRDVGPFTVVSRV